MRFRAVLALVAAAFVMAVLSVTGGRLGASTRDLPARQRDAIATEIETLVRRTYDLRAPNVADRLLALYADSGRVVSASAGQMLTSRDSLARGLRDFWNQVGREMRDPEWVWDRFAFDVLGPDAAVMTATYRIPHRTPRGEPHEVGGAWTAAWVRRDGRWRIVQEHLSETPSPIILTPDSTSAAGVDTTLLRGRE
jgi:uncharacterized protein (TIGR02246 family)